MYPEISEKNAGVQNLYATSEDLPCERAVTLKEAENVSCLSKRLHSFQLHVEFDYEYVWHEETVRFFFKRSRDRLPEI